MRELSLPFTECGLCGAALGAEDLVGVSPINPVMVQTGFGCEQCGSTVVVFVEMTQFVEWIADTASLFGEWLSEMTPVELMEFWDSQAVVDPDRIPLEDTYGA